ncbi:MAG TPA: iron-containing alcohol dehydrogenase family protein [Candidatus Binataceae bacterium]|nr:iron-containing alcohol dehydrogenase family protein [Candidatus Binataceae bacterium]
MSPIRVETWPKRLILGTGSIDTLAAVAAGLGARRILVLCGKTVASGPILSRVRTALGNLCCGVFDQVASHTPLPMVQKIVAMVNALEVDALVSVGGGSAIDAGKGTALLHKTAGALEPYVIRYLPDGTMQRKLMAGATITHIAIPTTSGSSSEVLPTAGIRDPKQRRKLLFWDDTLIPHAAILDPEMAIHTNPTLTATSGMTAVARCIESLYSSNRNPFAEGLALHALRLLYRNLPRAIEEPQNLDVRHQCQVACSMSGVAAINSMVSVVHALGHIVGGRYGLQHGVSHSILLAPAMRRFMPVLGERQRLVLEAMGAEAISGVDEAGAAADLMTRLIARLPLKRQLRDLGIPSSELAEIAQQAAHDYMMANVPIPTSIGEIEALLRMAW